MITKILLHSSQAILYLILLLFLTVNCNKNTEINSHETDYKSITENLNSEFGWAIEKDFKLFYKLIANDSNFISVTPYKRVKFGFEEVRKDSLFWGDPKFKAISHEIKDLTIQFSRSGNDAWFFCIVNDYYEWDGQPASWENTRWTGVLEERNGKWVIVLQHFSFATDN